MGKPDDLKSNRGMCFVIMPIGELSNYPNGHFKQVYEDIFKPAIEKAGYEPKRADDDKGSNMIQVGILEDIVSAPMAICDLSTRNPNVLFELGIRQAFDLPVVLVQEEGTPRIFDIGNFNTIDYGKELYYRDVLRDIEKIHDGIISTRDKSKGVNSIIKLLKIGKAELTKEGKLSSEDETQMLLYSVLNRLDKMQDEFEKNNLASSRKYRPTTLQPREDIFNSFGGSEKITDVGMFKFGLDDIEDELLIKDGKIVMKKRPENNNK